MLSTIEITNNYESNNTEHSLSDEISVLNYKELDYDHFFRSHLKPNIPCIIKNVTENWNCHKKWLINNGTEINYKYIEEKYGDCQVPIANCSEKFYNAQKKTDMRVRDYLNYFKNRDSQLLYLKDWHLRKCFPEDNFYNVPIYFASDWLNEYSLDKNEDDFMFVYMGPKGTWTPFHADVYQSFSWSVNITGRKRWLLFPPNEEKQLIDKLGNLPYDITEGNTENTIPHNLKYFDICQNQGEVIFVPSSWYHQVWNLEDTISINHNWINGCNLETIWRAFKLNLSDIKTEISDCSQMDSYDEHCQIMLKAVFGMDYRRFFDLLFHISRKRLSKILYDIDVVLFDDYLLGKEHCKFDLSCILKVLKDFVLNEDVLKIDWTMCDKSPKDLIVDIENVLL